MSDFSHNEKLLERSKASNVELDYFMV